MDKPIENCSHLAKGSFTNHMAVTISVPIYADKAKSWPTFQKALAISFLKLSNTFNNNICEQELG